MFYYKTFILGFSSKSFNNFFCTSNFLVDVIVPSCLLIKSAGIVVKRCSLNTESILSPDYSFISLTTSDEVLSVGVLLVIKAITI